MIVKSAWELESLTGTTVLNFHMTFFNIDVASTCRGRLYRALLDWFATEALLCFTCSCRVISCR